MPSISNGPSAVLMLLVEPTEDGAATGARLVQHGLKRPIGRRPGRRALPIVLAGRRRGGRYPSPPPLQ
jgi:hypothetical protein